jgi:hypothetical protein
MAAHDNGHPPARAIADQAEKQQLPGLTKDWLTVSGFNGVVGHKDQLKTEFARKVLGQLQTETAGTDCGWWDTRMADVLIEIARTGPLVVALAGIAAALRDGGDPDIVTGGTTAEAAFEVAQEWIDAGIEPGDVAGWLRAGCWSAAAARRMADAGLRPDRLLDDDDRPAHWVEVPNGEEMPLAKAVAEEFTTVAAAVRRIVGR